MFFISASISVVVMGLLRFSVFSWFSFVRLYNRIYQFIPSCLFYWHIVADKQSLMILCISVLSVVISPFSFLILLIWVFSLFFLDEFVHFVYLHKEPAFSFIYLCYAAATAKLLQSCLTLCNPIDGSPPGSLVPGILQARTLEWVAISFSNAWKWKVKGKSLSHVRLLVTP